MNLLNVPFGKQRKRESAALAVDQRNVLKTLNSGITTNDADIDSGRNKWIR